MLYLQGPESPQSEPRLKDGDDSLPRGKRLLLEHMFKGTDFEELVAIFNGKSSRLGSSSGGSASYRSEDDSTETFDTTTESDGAQDSDAGYCELGEETGIEAVDDAEGDSKDACDDDDDFENHDDFNNHHEPTFTDYTLDNNDWYGKGDMDIDNA